MWDQILQKQRLTPFLVSLCSSLCLFDLKAKEALNYETFYFLFIYFLILIFTLFYFTILYWFCHTLTWIRHGCTWVPNPESPSHLLPHIISLDHPRAPAPRKRYIFLNSPSWGMEFRLAYLDFPGGSDSKGFAYNAGDLESINPLVGKIPWRMKWQPTAVFLLGKSHGQKSLVGYSSWGGWESDTTKHFHFQNTILIILSGGSDDKESACNAIDLLQYTCMENHMDRGAWLAI